MIIGPSIACGIPAGPRHQGVGRVSTAGRRGAGVAHQRRAAGVLLEATVLAAAAELPVTDDPEVPDLAAHPERAAVELAVEDEAAADAGARP